jgi:hypothetical protein
MPSNAHLDKGRRRYHVERERAGRPAADPFQTTSRRAAQLGYDSQKTTDFCRMFSEIRRLHLSGADTEHLLRRFTDELDDDLAVAAYHEALASTRPAGWAQ